jgi:hypothetical protein
MRENERVEVTEYDPDLFHCGARNRHNALEEGTDLRLPHHGVLSSLESIPTRKESA